MEGAHKRQYQRQRPVTAVLCPHCGATNPVKAYCCITCFKVMHQKAKVPFWNVEIRPSVPFSVFILCVIAFLIYYLVLWMRDIEAQVTMNLNTGDYSLSVVADKRKSEGININTDSGRKSQKVAPSENTPQ